MEQRNRSTSDEVISALRRIIRSIDLHSRSLVQTHGLTGPQAALLKALAQQQLTAGELANRINLSQGTVTDILNRLEKRDLVRRIKDEQDRRRVIVDLTEKSRAIVGAALPLVQDHFSRRFVELPDWEQSQLLASLQRISHMMEADIPLRVRESLVDDIAVELVGLVGAPLNAA